MGLTLVERWYERSIMFSVRLPVLSVCIIIIIKTFVRFLIAHTTHWDTHVHIWRRHRTHTHTRTSLFTQNLTQSPETFFRFPITVWRQKDKQSGTCSREQNSNLIQSVSLHLNVPVSHVQVRKCDC